MVDTSDVKATLILGDYARVADGKLDVLGGGWTAAGPGPISMGIGVVVEVPWDERSETHSVRLALVDADGRQVQLQQADGSIQRIEIETTFELVAGAEHPAGSPLPFCMAANLPGLPLPPKHRFEWLLTVDGKSFDSWRAAFSTRGE